MTDKDIGVCISITTQDTLPLVPSEDPRDIKKRKRPLSMASCKKTVRFNTEETQVIPTWSSVDYDRGGLFSSPVLYKVNPAILNPPRLSSKPKLSVDIQACANISSRYDEEEDSAGLSGGSTCSSVSTNSPDTPADHRPSFPLPSVNNNKSSLKPDGPSSSKPNRPRLSVDTSMCSGPSVFTTLSANTIPRLIASQDEESTSSDFLVPMSAVPV